MIRIRSRFLTAGIVAVTLTWIAPAASANEPPRAIASGGVDPHTGQALNQVTLFIGPADTGIAHTLSGAGSFDSDGDPLAYSWACISEAVDGKCAFLGGVATHDVSFRPTFPPGTFDVTLTVNDGHGHTATDSIRVKVFVDQTPPTVTPPDEESVSATEGGGARGSASSELHHFLFNSATASDNASTTFMHLPPRVNGVDVDDNTLFPHGRTTVTFRFADTHGNVGTATADVFVTDLQSGDLFVGVHRPSAFGTFKGVVQRIRGSVVTDFCESPEPVNGPVPPGQPVFWNRPDQIVVDSKGRVTFLAALHFGSTLQPSIQNGWGLLRCNKPGQPAEQLGVFPQGTYIDPGWPEPKPGAQFYAPGLPPVQPLTGLHLRKVKYVAIDDDTNGGQPQIVTDESYVFAYHESSIPDNTAGTIGSLSLHTDSLSWKENDLGAPVAIENGSTGWLPEMFFHSKTETISFGPLSLPAPVAKTYASRFGVLRRIHHPFEVRLTANTSAGTVFFGVRAFGGDAVITPHPGLGGIITDDVTIPNPASGCNPTDGARGDWPQRLGGYSVLQTDGVIFEKDSGLVINSGFSMPSWAGHVDEALFDLNSLNDAGSRFAMPEVGCARVPVVNFTPLAGGVANPAGSSVADLTYDVDPTGWGFHPNRMAASPNGLFGTQSGSPFTGVSTGRVVKATGARDLTVVAEGLQAPKGLGAYPPELGNIQLSAVIIRIDSPVDVLVTDSSGRRVGVENGQSIDEFDGQAHDTGVTTHPRLYLIQHPQPGTYTVRSRGTGHGSFSVHVYSLDSEKDVRAHIVQSGIASPDSVGTHDFVLDPGGHVAFSNAAPVANAGFDQTADPNASGTAAVVLDGLGSSDLDGDALAFRWAGPFGILDGAQVTATLGPGVHVLTLTVDDGKGGMAKDDVTVTVNAIADATGPMITPTVAGTVGADGWYTTDVTVSWTVVDLESAVSSTTGCAPTLVATDGADISFTCAAISGGGQSSETVTFKRDATPPVQTVPGPQFVLATSAAGAIVNYAVTAVDPTSGVAGVNCMPASGSQFAIGTTHVSCTATNNAGMASAPGVFDVTVTAATSPDGRMHGAGFIVDRGTPQHFVFQVSQRHDDSGRFKFWTTDGRRDTNRFEATSITAGVFADTAHVSGTGRWNGVSGYTFEAVASDRGEPGRHRDGFSLIVKDNRGGVVVNIGGQLAGGNIQSLR